MAQQTAMNALWEWIDANYHEDNFNINDARDMSLKLEKEQICEAWKHGKQQTFLGLGKVITSEEYYNETYNK